MTSMFERKRTLELRTVQQNGHWYVIPIVPHREAITDKSIQYPIHPHEERYLASSACSDSIGLEIFYLYISYDGGQARIITCGQNAGNTRDRSGFVLSRLQSTRVYSCRTKMNAARMHCRLSNGILYDETETDAFFAASEASSSAFRSAAT